MSKPITSLQTHNVGKTVADRGDFASSRRRPCADSRVGQGIRRQGSCSGRQRQSRPGVDGGPFRGRGDRGRRGRRADLARRHPRPKSRALISEAFEAQALGIRNILCTSGSHQTLGRFRAAKNVYDIDSIQLLQAYANLAGECKLVGEDGVVGAGPFCLGAVASPDAHPPRIAGVAIAEKDGCGGRVSSSPSRSSTWSGSTLVERGEAARRYHRRSPSWPAFSR